MPTAGGITADAVIPILERGQVQTGVGRGFAPGELVTGQQLSSPLELGTQIADASGVVTFTWTIRSDETLGTHSFVVTGTDSGSASDTFEVVGSLPRTGTDIARIVVIAVAVAGLGASIVVATVALRRGS
jgi:hypothetical protein